MSNTTRKWNRTGRRRYGNKPTESQLLLRLYYVSISAETRGSAATHRRPSDLHANRVLPSCPRQLIIGQVYMRR